MSKNADDRLDRLFDAARAARERAYAPYSHFAVGAAVFSESGAIHAGCNVENAAYPQGSCAETGAISAMVAAGDRRIVDIVVVGAGEELVTPCGGCRQRIREFADAETRVHVADLKGIRSSFRISELLPYSFGPQNLTHS
ncbi:MAG: cytidine deaminase [Rhizobiales bacterium]|nr:cytidine deaminase [Hyphomicrobiales bacterium]